MSFIFFFRKCTLFFDGDGPVDRHDRGRRRLLLRMLRWGHNPCLLEGVLSSDHEPEEYRGLGRGGAAPRDD